MGKVRLACTRCGAERRFGGVSSKTHCRECDKFFKVDDGIIAFYKDSKVAQDLARGPIPGGSRHDLNNLRHVAEVLKKPTSRNRGETTWPGIDKGPEGPQFIIYLPGDERQAITMFIEMNTELVDSCLKHPTGNPISHEWSEYHYEILKEQWWWLGYGDDYAEKPVEA